MPLNLFFCYLGVSDSPQASPAKKKMYTIASEKLALIKADTPNQKTWDEILSSYETITVGCAFYILFFHFLVDVGYELVSNEIYDL